MGTNSGVATGFAKCFISFMAIVIFLEGCIYCGLAVWGLVVDSCSEQTTDLSSNPFKFVMDLIYFASKDCGNPLITVSGIEGEVPIIMNWDKSFIITNREFIFMIVYAVVSVFWILTSIMVLGTLCGPMTKCVIGFCYWPWFLFVMGGSVLDVVATVYHVMDITHTTSSTDTLDFVGGTIENSVVLEYLSTFDPYFIVPAVVMTCVSCRVVLIWLLNIFGVGFCLSLSNVLVQRNSTESQGSAAPVVREIEYESSPTQRQPPPIQPKPQSLPPVQMQQPEEQYPPPQIQPKPLVIQPAPLSPATPSPQQQQQSPQAVHPILVLPSAAAPPTNEKVPQQAQELSPISPLNTRYSSAESPFQLPSQPQRVSAELRSQLPWSYTSGAGKPQPPRKPSAPVYPEIPEPDYSEAPTRREQAQQPTAPMDMEPQSQIGYSRW